MKYINSNSEFALIFYMCMIEVSFVIPFYNGSSYIRTCLDSLFAQNISETRYEVVIVDDCSTDSMSVRMLEDYCNGHANMRIIHNPVNVRCGESRNIGVKNALGKYIWFVDQDDKILERCISLVIDTCIRDDLDMLYFNYQTFNNLGDKFNICNLVEKDSTIMSGLDFIKSECSGDFWSNRYDTNVWHSVFKRDFLCKNCVFSPPVSYCEDMIVALKAVVMAKRFKAIPAPLYCYRNNPQSVYNTQVGVKGRPVFDASLYAGSQIVLISELIPTNDESLRDMVKSGGIHRVNSFTKVILKINKRERKEFFNCVVNNKAVLNVCKPFLTPINQWILRYKYVVCKIPMLIWLYIKFIELLC